MWSKLDDELLDHRKILQAGELIGKNGPAIALGFYTIGLLWSNKHLTDGHLPQPVVNSFRQVAHPASIAHALVQAGLWDKTANGFQIHNFSDWNPSATSIKKRRKADRIRKQHERANGKPTQ
jgi:hypothetical protein